MVTAQQNINLFTRTKTVKGYFYNTTEKKLIN